MTENRSAKVNEKQRAVTAARAALKKAEQDLAAAQVRFDITEKRLQMPWPRRIRMQLHDIVVELPDELGYFGMYVCGWGSKSDEFQSLYDMAEGIFLYFDIYEDGSRSLVGIHDPREGHEVKFGNCAGGDYEEEMKKFPDWDEIW